MKVIFKYSFPIITIKKPFFCCFFLSKLTLQLIYGQKWTNQLWIKELTTSIDLDTLRFQNKTLKRYSKTDINRSLLCLLAVDERTSRRRRWSAIWGFTRPRCGWQSFSDGLFCINIRALKQRRKALKVRRPNNWILSHIHKIKVNTYFMNVSWNHRCTNECVLRIGSISF